VSETVFSGGFSFPFAKTGSGQTWGQTLCKRIRETEKYRYAQTGGESCNTTAKPGELCPKQTLEEYRTEFTMWSMASSPLLVSTDVRKLTVRKRSF
jgi:hypothetical protein